MKNKFDELKKFLPNLQLSLNVPFKSISTLGAGIGHINIADVNDDYELSQLLDFCFKNEIKVIVFGAGSNLVGSDEDFDDLLIRLSGKKFKKITIGRNHLTAGAFASLSELAKQSATAGLSGLEELVGIPGTLGGAIRMNAGANGSEIGMMITQICGCKLDGTPWVAEGDELEFSYRKCSMPTDVIVTGAILKLSAISDKNLTSTIKDELARRKEREPFGRSAGCTFRNVSYNISAGKLIDACGLKGYKIGEFEVSSKHANYIINNNSKGAKAQDYLKLLCHIRRAVAEKFNFILRPEVVFIDPKMQEELNQLSPIKICLLKGGVSSEREVSLRSGAAVANALRNCGYIVYEEDITECKISKPMLNCDVVFPVLHGGFGEDGTLQKLLEDNSIRFVGSGSVTSRLVMDKIASKKMFDSLGIPTANWAIINKDNPVLPNNISYPIVIKVPCEGSSIGIAKVENENELLKSLDELFKYTDELLVEEFILGDEITIPVVNGEVLPAIEICSAQGFYDYDAKYIYEKGKTQYFCPVKSISQEVIKNAEQFAKMFYLESNGHDVMRIDFIIGEKDSVAYALEGNSLPGFTATSLVPKSAKVAGISFEELVSNMVRSAMLRSNNKKEKSI